MFIVDDENSWFADDAGEALKIWRFDREAQSFQAWIAFLSSDATSLSASP